MCIVACRARVVDEYGADRRVDRGRATGYHFISLCIMPSQAEHVTEADERAIAAFLAPPGSGPKERTLADVIAEKLKEAETAAAERGGREGEEGGGGRGGGAYGLDDKVVEVYTG